MSASPAGLRLQCDMPVMFASLPRPEGVLVHQAAWVTEGVGAWQRGSWQWGVLRHTCTPIPSAGERYKEWDDCDGGGSREKGRESGGGGGGVAALEWKNTISPALLQCLSSQLVTLKHKS